MTSVENGDSLYVIMVELYTKYGVKAKNTFSYIRKLRSKMRYAHKGDVIVVGAGENKEDIGIGVAWLGDEDVAVHDACYILMEHEQNPTLIYLIILQKCLLHKQLKIMYQKEKFVLFLQII